MANERKGNAGRGQRASQAVREETDHPTAFSPLGGQLPTQEKKKKGCQGGDCEVAHLEALDSLAKYYLVDLT